MPRQSFIWTALPNGYSADGQALHLSILMSPRLDPEAAPHRLDSFFPDWEDWPSRIRAAHFKVSFGAQHVLVGGTDLVGLDRLDDRLGLADSAVWRALFKADRLVRPHIYKDRSANRILTYDTVGMAEWIERLYGDLAGKAGDEMPLVSDFVDDREWGGLIKDVAGLDAGSTDRLTGLRDPARQFARLNGEPWARSGIQGLERFQLFHTPPAHSEVREETRLDDPRIKTRWREHARGTLPAPADLNNELDFHQIVAAMAAYPTLMRRLGIVIDILLAPSRFTLAADAPLSVEVSFEPGTFSIPRASDARPVTRTRLTADSFEAISDPAAAFRTDGGLLELDTNRFGVLQLDVDGAGLKLLNFARSLGRLLPEERRVDPVTRHEDQLGAPSLRNGGLALVHRDRGSFLRSRMVANKDGNDVLESQLAGGSGAVTLHAEDLVRGYRFDVWDSYVEEWRSLCRRTARYELDGGVVVDVPEEETTVRLAATASSDPASNADILYLHETVMSWTGWSLAAPPVGRLIRPDDSVDAGAAQGEAESPPGLNFTSTFRAKPGSLPRLRFGRSYALRARVVDVAGNSLPFQTNDFGPEQPENRAKSYLRYDPLAAPILALVSQAGSVEVPGNGESVARMAIRSFNSKPSDNAVPSAQVARRAAVPPQVSVRDAEQHGMLDKGGKLDANLFNLLAHNKDIDPRDPGAVVRELVIPTGGPLSPPTDTVFAVHEVGRALTYLPDPLAVEVTARFFDHPAVADSEIYTIPLYPDAAEWPEAVPFTIELYEGDDDKQPTFDATSRRLRVPLPKGVKARLRLSMKLAVEALPKFAVFNLIPAAERATQEMRACNGQHWMLTPWREVELVHAVQKPLLAPDVMSLVVDRSLDATAAKPVMTVRCSLASTDRLDLLAEWHEPDDNPGEGGRALPSDRPRWDLAFSVKVAGPKDFAQRMHGARAGGYSEHVIVGDDLIGVNVTEVASHERPLVQPKQHEFHDTRYRRIAYYFEATTRFREYMPPALLTHQQDEAAVPTDANIKVEGRTIIGWIPSSAPPPAPAVLYVVPTFGWTRRVAADGRVWSERGGGGLRVYLDRGWNASGYGEMLAVVLPPAGFAGDPDTTPKGLPYRGYVTQWANDPVWDAAFVKGIAPTRADFPLARLGPDLAGSWLPPGAPLTEADQKPGPFTVTGLRPPRSANPAALVEVAPHDVIFDSERGLWFSDIVIEAGRSYFPFVRLALARYQPISCPGAHLSPIVLADFMALAAGRWLSVAPTDQSGVLRVALYGHRPVRTSGHVEASGAVSMSLFSPFTGQVEELRPTAIAQTNVVEISIEWLDPEFGEDFGWRRVEEAAIAQEGPNPLRVAADGGGQGLTPDAIGAVAHGEVSPTVSLQSESLSLTPILWEGKVTIPLGGRARHRLVVTEYEEYLVDDDRPYDKVPTQKDRRIVYLEHVELPPSG